MAIVKTERDISQITKRTIVAMNTDSSFKHMNNINIIMLIFVRLSDKT
jgi:hypothetical protein